MKPRNREEATRRMQKLAASCRVYKTIHKKANERRLAIQERLDDLRRQQAELRAASAEVQKEFERREKDLEAMRTKVNNSRMAALKECVDTRAYEELVAAEHNKLIREMISIERKFDVFEYEASTSTEEKIKSFGSSLQFSLEDTDDEMGDDGVVVSIEDDSGLDVDSGNCVPSPAGPSANVQSAQPALNSSDSASRVFGTRPTSSTAASLRSAHATLLRSSASGRVYESFANNAVDSGATGASSRIGETVFALISGTFFPAIVASVHLNDRIGVKLVDNYGEPHDAIKIMCAKDIVPMSRFRRDMKMHVRVWIDGCAYGRTVVIRKKPVNNVREFFVLEDMKSKETFTARWNIITFRWEHLSRDVLQALIESTEDNVDDDE